MVTFYTLSFKQNMSNFRLLQFLGNWEQSSASCTVYPWVTRVSWGNLSCPNSINQEMNLETQERWSYAWRLESNGHSNDPAPTNSMSNTTQRVNRSTCWDLGQVWVGSSPYLPLQLGVEISVQNTCGTSTPWLSNPVAVVTITLLLLLFKHI